jgi:hypothetical protein
LERLNLFEQDFSANQPNTFMNKVLSLNKIKKRMGRLLLDHTRKNNKMVFKINNFV